MREKISFTVSAPEPRNIIKARKTGVNLSYYGSSLWSGCSGTGMFGRGTSVWNFCTSPQAALLGGNHCISFSLVFAFLPLIWVATSQRDRFIYCTEKGKMEILNFQLTAESGANAKVYTNGLSSESVSACLALHYYLRQRRYSLILRRRFHSRRPETSGNGFKIELCQASTGRNTATWVTISSKYLLYEGDIP